MEFAEENINDIKNKSIDKLIQDYMAFIVKTVSSITGRYVSVENDDELSIALIAFKEAIDKYEESRGSFSAFAKLVISSRVKNYLIKENKNNKVESIEALKEKGIDISEVAETVVEESDELSNEIGKLKEEIEAFGFTFEDLVDEAPKHEDTRRNAIELSEKVSKEKSLTSFMYEKRRLPIKQISVKFSVTEKVIKRSKKFIISVVIIIDKNFRNLRLWIKR
ncbi:sigma-70 family RNA polymerase sigma factor [Clostridium sp. NSJ-6]|uniref:RNA polymerase sigma factor SigI n=1 Tax=Clostridium hominis TaxID=2763036 RepID=A0ABR7DDL1_9CLOT|nr:sigma-70 family RNA polymerase sigma factor [Clostridium hominis]MBC5629437.1 sigma-70 family RNA polymerase sigma factor [Clostridium hominis]MDU2671335.1 sigma-70 family RNA polymerase sigma factor [Clostridium sp.]